MVLLSSVLILKISSRWFEVFSLVLFCADGSDLETDVGRRLLTFEGDWLCTLHLEGCS